MNESEQELSTINQSNIQTDRSTNQENEELLTQRTRAGQKQDKEEKKWVLRSESPPPLRDNTVVPYKVIFLTFLLFFAGLLFLFVGYERYINKSEEETYPVIILGILLLIPGGYHVVYLILIWLKVEGYTYDQLPQIADD